MNTPLTHRLAAAVAAIAITFTLFSAVVSEAEPTAATQMLAQAAATATVR